MVEAPQAGEVCQPRGVGSVRAVPFANADQLEAMAAKLVAHGDGVMSELDGGAGGEDDAVLPESIDVDSIAAELTNGVLHVTVAKKPEAQPKRIEIRG